MLKDYEEQAVFAILVRCIEAARRREAAAALVVKAEEAKAEDAATLKQGIDALKMFGIDSGQKVWEVVKHELGDVRYNSAFERACTYNAGTLEPVYAHGRPTAADNLDTKVLESEADEAVAAEVAASSSIKEMVLSHLQRAGSAGVSGRAIKKLLKEQGVTMHEKTVGMNLWRLAQDGLARRDKLTWYHVPPKNEEPADQHIGSDESTGSVFE